MKRTMTHLSGVPRRALAAAILAAALAGPSARAGTVRVVRNGSDSLAAPAADSLRQVLSVVQSGDTIRFEQNFSIQLDPAPHSELRIGRGVTGVTLEGPAELRNGALLVEGAGTTITGLRFANLRVTAGSTSNFDDGTRTDAFVFRGNTLIGDSALALVLTSNAVVEDNTFDVREPKGDSAIRDFASEHSRWSRNTWTETSTGGFHESECTDIAFDGANRVVGDAIFQARSGRIADNEISGHLRAFHCDLSVNGTLTLENNRCATLGAFRPDVAVLGNTVTGTITAAGKPKPFPITRTAPPAPGTPLLAKPAAVKEQRVTPFSVSMAQVTGDAGFVRVRGNTVTATSGWTDGMIVGATALATECVVEDNAVGGGKLRTLQVNAAKSAVVTGNRVTSGGKLGALVVLGAGTDGVTLAHNVVDGGAGPGIVLARAAGSATLTANDVKDCKGGAVETDRALVSDDGVYRDCGAGVVVGKKTKALIRGGSVTGHRGPGVFADSGAAVEIVRTQFGGNAGPGIDLTPPGVTPNARKKKANGNVPYPDTLEYDASTGRAKGRAEPLARVDAYAVEEGARAGNPNNGEGAQWLGEVVAGADGKFTFPAAGRLTCPPSKRVTFTATRPGADAVTSEFSLDVDCSGASLVLIDQTPAGGPGNKSGDGSRTVLSERYGTISQDGRFVVFTSASDDLVEDDTNGTIDVFLRDTVLGTTTRVNRTPSGGQVAYEFTTQPDAGSAPSISADGRWIVYTSRAENSFDSGTWYFNDPGVILFDTQTGTNTVVASPLQLDDPLPSGSHTYGGAYYASISGDGSAVIFAARGPDYAPGDAGDDNDAFVWTRATGAYERVSEPTGGGDVNNGWQQSTLTAPRLSYDARFAVFSSHHDFSGATQYGPLAAWVRDRQASTTIAASVDGAGVVHSGYDAWISDDGRFVVFTTEESLVPADTDAFSAVYLRDRQAGTTTLVSAKPDGSGFYGHCFEPSISGDGRWVAFRNFEKVYLLDRQSAAMTVVSGSATTAASSYCYRPRLSRTGQFLVFETDATNLTDLGGQTFITHVYLRDLTVKAK